MGDREIYLTYSNGVTLKWSGEHSRMGTHHLLQERVKSSKQPNLIDCLNS